MKKNKLINLILYYNEPELLEKRMSYYEGVVDEFITIDLKTLGISYNEVLKSNYLKDLIKSIPNLNFDDTFWLSKVNEIVPKELIQDVKTYSDFEVFNHTILNWSDNLSLNRNIMGSCVFSYSSVLRNKKLFEEIDFYYSQPRNITKIKLLGYSLIGFQNLNELSIFLHVFYGLNFTSQELLDLKLNMISVDPMNKPMVLKDINCKLGGHFNINFEPRPPKNFDVTIEEEGVWIDSKFYKNDCPKNYVLGTKMDYIKNELLFLLQSHFVLDDDTLVIKNKTEDKSSVLKYSVFKNSIPSEIT
jgi:hypothetical protein